MPDEPEWFTLSELTERLSQLIWAAESMAEILGVWASTESRHRPAILYAEASGHYRWHGETLRGCLPTSEQLVEQSQVVAPANWQPAVDMMHTLTADDDAHIRLVVLQREVYPWLEREVAALLDVANPVGERHIMRWLGFVSLDHDNHRQRLSALLSEFDAEPRRLSDRAVLAAVHLRG